MEEIDRLASFYLGKEYDLAARQVTDRPVMYDARDLTTHAVCLGMTGSGKTGLGAVLLEEATLDGVPSIVIDPKGDMTNLLLTFPDLRPEDFAPWANPDDARRQNVEMDAYAAQTAQQWRAGLAEWGIGPERIRQLKESADFTVYTPGSNTGRRVSIVQTLKAPPLSWDTDAEVLRDQIGSLASALLALVGIEADPVRSREHILLSNIVEQAWRAGQDLDLAQLILRVQKPPFSQLGVFPVETFFPEDDRMELAMLLNGLIAAPSFADWIDGEPLDVDRFLSGPTGKPQVSIFYIAHLGEAERQFFVTLLLQQVVTWLNAQSGTTSLRALLYMDELFGYMPPHPANPPTKKPLLTLLKQARAFGLGLVLTTQNPVDLDYKALANAGTWFIGKMQTERDKLRVLDGLEGAQVAVGDAGRGALDRLISALTARVFLLHNVHASHPIVFETRWAMSYLRGPLTRPQIRELVAEAPPQSPPWPQTATGGRPEERMATGGRQEEAPPWPPPERGTGGKEEAAPLSSPWPAPGRGTGGRPEEAPPQSPPWPPLRPEASAATGGREDGTAVPTNATAPAGPAGPARPTIPASRFMPAASARAADPAATTSAIPSAANLSPAAGLPYGPVPAQLPSTVRQVFLPVQLGVDEALDRLLDQQGWAEGVRAMLQPRLIYDPALIGLAVVRYVHTKTRQSIDRAYAYLLPVEQASGFIDWPASQVELDAGILEPRPAANAAFGQLPPELGNAGRFKALEKELADTLYYNTSATVLYNPHLKLYSAPDEAPKAFQRRCREAARVARDADAAKIEARYQVRIDQVAAKLRREERELDDDKTEYEARKREEFFSGAETVLDMFTGRRMRRSISTASRKRRLTKQAQSEVQDSEETIDDLDKQIQELQAALQGELDDATARWADLIDDVQEEQVRPRRTDVRVNLFGLAWAPAWEIAVSGQVERYRVAAFEVG